MVSNTSIVYLFISLAICFLLPMTLAALITMKSENKKIAIKAIFLGVASFVVFQLIIRVPILTTVLPKIEFYNNLNTLQLSVFLGLTAALFETVGRVVFIRFLKGEESFKNGFAHGVGHGGIEAILLVGFSLISVVAIALMINNGTFETFLNAPGMTEEGVVQLNAVKTQLLESKPYMFLLGGLERALAIVVHIGLSILIMEGMYKKNLFLYSIIAILLHGSLDFFVAYLSALEVNVLVIEAVVAVYAAIMLAYITTAKKRFKTVRKNPS